MKTWIELSEKQQRDVLKTLVEDEIIFVLEGNQFNDELNKDDLQARINRAIDKADQLSAPWLAGRFLIEDPYIKECLEGMALARAEDLLYRSTDEPEIKTLPERE